MINLKKGCITPGKWEQGIKEHQREEKTKSVLRSSLFQNCCEKAEIKPTKRQAVKFKNERGLAYSLA